MKIRAKVILTADFTGPPQGTIEAAKRASEVLAKLVNTRFQDKESGMFLTVNSVKSISTLRKRGLKK